MQNEPRPIQCGCPRRPAAFSVAATTLVALVAMSATVTAAPAPTAPHVEARLESIRAGDPLDGAAEPLKSVPATKDGRRLAAGGAKPPRTGRKQAAAKERLVSRRGRSPR